MKVIKTKADHQAALVAIDHLIAMDPDPGTPEAERLELLSLIIRDYEERQFPIPLPDPISAIQFRMEQLGLEPRDLIPIMGSRGRVSEILSGKRGLSLAMMRGLREKLGIPAAVLLQDTEHSLREDQQDDLVRFPVAEMIRRSWISVSDVETPGAIKAAVARFIAPIREADTPLQALFRMTRNVRSDRTLDHYAVMAWTARVLQLAANSPISGVYRPEALSDAALDGLVRLSVLDEGPKLAREYLAQYGIALVIVEHLPRTRLDGAVFLMKDGRAVIGLTLRHDRLDNFWFTLFHELAHLRNDLSRSNEGFVDDLDSGAGDDPRESEADAFARDTLIPLKAWEQSPARSAPNPTYVRQLASQLGINPAIVAGRIQYERNSYRILRGILGHGKVRKCFPEFRSTAA